MGLRLALLNWALRVREKPFLARATPEQLRLGFEKRAALWFRMPKGVAVNRARLDTLDMLQLRPSQVPTNGVVLYLHGGGYVFGSPDTHKAMVAQLCLAAGTEALVPRYRRAPEHPFPAALDDARAAYAHLLSAGFPSSHIILGGDSAGGGLVLALLHELIDRGDPLPAGVFAFSPLTDMTFSGASLEANAQAEVMLPRGREEELGGMYLDGHDPRDPRVSPLFGDFRGGPPVFLTVGDYEILLDDSRRLAAALKDAGVETELRVERSLPHVWPMFRRVLPQARRTLTEVGGWINQRLPHSVES